MKTRPFSSFRKWVWLSSDTQHSKNFWFYDLKIATFSTFFWNFFIMSDHHFLLHLHRRWSCDSHVAQPEKMLLLDFEPRVWVVSGSSSWNMQKRGIKRRALFTSTANLTRVGCDTSPATHWNLKTICTTLTWSTVTWHCISVLAKESVSFNFGTEYYNE